MGMHLIGMYLMGIHLQGVAKKISDPWGSITNKGSAMIISPIGIFM